MSVVSVGLSHCLLIQIPQSVNSTLVAAEPDYDELAWSAEPSDLPRAAMSPWQAVEQFGHVEPAFEHLQRLSSPPIPRQLTPLHRRTRAMDLSSTQNRLTSAQNGTVHVNISKRCILHYSNVFTPAPPTKRFSFFIFFK